MFMEEYAPRAALYEALPVFVPRLTGRDPARHAPVCTPAAEVGDYASVHPAIPVIMKPVILLRP